MFTVFVVVLPVHALLVCGITRRGTVFVRLGGNDGDGIDKPHQDEPSDDGNLVEVSSHHWLSAVPLQGS